MSEITVKIVNDTTRLESLSDVWNNLLSRGKDESSVFLTYEWVTTWWKHFGDGKKLNVLLMEKGPDVVGIIQLMRTDYRIGPFQQCVLETIGAVNYNCIALTSDENREEVAAAFNTYLEQELGKRGLVLRLPLVPDDNYFLESLRNVCSQLPGSLVFHEKLTTLAPYMPLPETWEDYYYSLAQKKRWLYRRKLRALQEIGSVKYLICNRRNLESRLNKFFELHQTRWQSVGVRGIFSDPKMMQFYIDVATLFLKKGWFHFSYLAVDGEMVSGEYCFIYGNKLYGSTTARDINYQKYSVGTLHFISLLRDAIEAGIREFDFLKGDEHYKFHWTRLFRKYLQVVVMKKGWFPILQIKWFDILLRAYELRQYDLKEVYHLYLLRKRERAEKKRMGLHI